MRNRAAILAAILCLLLVLAACGGEDAIASKDVTELTKGFHSEIAGVQLPEQIPLQSGDFSAQLLMLAAEQETDPVLSPLSVWLALSMCANGAAGQTLAEFDGVLGDTAAERNALAAALTGSLTDVGGSTELTIANSAWADDQALIYEDFLQDIVSWYGAEAYQADLPSDAALAAINKWVRLNTNGLIETLHEDNYPDDTVLALLNTLYFKSKWQQPFMAHSTRDKDFKLAGGGTVQAPFMQAHQTHRAYISQPGMEGVLLPYDDGQTAFLALRPTDGGSARELAATLSNEAIAACVEGAEYALMNFSMPKFIVEFATELNAPLQQMGLVSAFDPGAADFTKMGEDPRGPLYISRVFQKVKIIVDEDGAEAAAATEVSTAPASAPPQDAIELHFDSPFVYVVVDLQSNFPLFMGIMDDPAA